MNVDTQPHACHCIGPQNGQPLCPCAMRGVQVVNGRYVLTQDLGPVREKPSDDLMAELQRRLTSKEGA